MIKPEAEQTKYIYLALIISASCSMFQNQASLTRAKFANFKTSHEISYTWNNDLVYDLLAKERNLRIVQLMKFW